jgi:Lon protease-like protein
MCRTPAALVALACHASDRDPGACRYTARIAETVALREGWRRTLPIFFYNDPLVPASPLHLHLFEMRYRIMIRRIMESNRQFLYLPNFTDYLPHAVRRAFRRAVYSFRWCRPHTVVTMGAGQGDIALVAHVSECEVMPDGRAYLAARLRTRVRVVEHWVEESTAGLYFCTVEDVHDAPLSDEDRRRARDALSSVREAARRSTDVSVPCFSLCSCVRVRDYSCWTRMRQATRRKSWARPRPSLGNRPCKIWRRCRSGWWRRCGCPHRTAIMHCG